MSTGMYPGPRPDRAAAQRQREAALARLTRVRGVTLIGAAALTAAVAGVVSAASGRTLGAKHYIGGTRASVQRPAAPAKLPPLASASQLGLGAPASAPQPVPSAPPQAQVPAPQSAPQSAPAPAVSGGS
ncbi:MAG: hypothetical protein ACRDNK_19265 [Solirubrobacteraceae bacterium]